MNQPRAILGRIILGAWIAAGVLAAAGAASAQVSVEARLSGSWARFSLTEVNRSLAAWEKLRTAEAAVNPAWTLQGGGDIVLHRGLEFEGEIVLNLTSWAGIGVSSGFTYAETTEETSPLLIRKDGDSYSIGRPTRVSGIPVVVSGHLSVPLAEGLRLYARVGGGGMRARYLDRESSIKEEDERYVYPVSQRAAGRARLFQGGLGLQYGRGGGPAFFVEGLLRRCRIEDLEGETKDGVEGTLYAFEEYDAGLDEWLPRLQIKANQPDGPGVRAAAPAAIDFGGVLVRLGVIVRF